VPRFASGARLQVGSVPDSAAFPVVRQVPRRVLRLPVLGGAAPLRRCSSTSSEKTAPCGETHRRRSGRSAARR
jgi:hypothetical protein